jgi:hypothetical protein
MNASKKVSALALLLSMLAGGCASETTDDGEEASEDALGSLSTSEVVGSLKLDWYAGEAAAPTVHDNVTYRAFEFDANAGQKLVAYVVTNNDTDPMAYILDASFRMLKRNDDRATSVKDAAIAFTPPATGKYYLAFRTKERTPATVMARIVDDELGGLRTKSFADGWPLRQQRAREDAYTYEQSKHAVNVSAFVKADAISITNNSGCPADPFRPGAGLSVPSSVTFTIDPVARRVTLGGGVVAGSGQIAADGTFQIDSGTDRWGFKRARGRVAAGGFVIVTHAETMDCHTNYAGAMVHDASQLNTAIGAADPNYR